MVYRNKGGAEHDGTAKRSNEYGDSDLSELIPENRLLSKSNPVIWFTFNYHLAAVYCPANGRSFIDPVSMLKSCWRDTFTASSQNAV